MESKEHIGIEEEEIESEMSRKIQRSRSERWGRDKTKNIRQRGKKVFPGWSPSQVSEHDVRSCLATVIRSLYRQVALFYFMYS